MFVDFMVRDQKLAGLPAAGAASSPHLPAVSALIQHKLGLLLSNYNNIMVNKSYY